jgi:hypothetical protein
MIPLAEHEGRRHFHFAADASASLIVVAGDEIGVKHDPAPRARAFSPRRPASTLPGASDPPTPARCAVAPEIDHVDGRMIVRLSRHSAARATTRISAAVQISPSAVIFSGCRAAVSSAISEPMEWPISAACFAPAASISAAVQSAISPMRACKRRTARRPMARASRAQAPTIRDARTSARAIAKACDRSPHRARKTTSGSFGVKFAPARRAVDLGAVHLQPHRVIPAATRAAPGRDLR